MEISLGDGKVLVSSVNRDGREGVLLQQTDTMHHIDEKAPENDGGPYEPGQDDVIIWLDHVDAARVLQDRVNIACLTMSGHSVTNA